MSCFRCRSAYTPEEGETQSKLLPLCPGCEAVTAEEAREARFDVWSGAGACRAKGKRAVELFDVLYPNGNMMPTFARWFMLGCGPGMRVATARAPIGFDATSGRTVPVSNEACERWAAPSQREGFLGAAFLVLDRAVTSPERTHYDLMVWVLPRYRRRGVGRRMVEMLRPLFPDRALRTYHRTDHAEGFFRSVL